MLALSGEIWQSKNARAGNEDPMGDPKNIIILLLIAAIAVLGYLYYDSRQTQVRIDVPGFKLEAK